jgi:hypothetical protein
MGVMVHAANQADLSDKMVSATATGLDPAKALADQQQMAQQMALADFFFVGGLVLMSKSIVDELGKLESGAAKAIKPGAPPPPDAPPPGGGGATGPGGPGKTNTNWPPFDPNGPATNRNWPPVDPNGPATNRNWPPPADPHGKTLPGPGPNAPVDPHGKTQPAPPVDPHGKTSVDPNAPPPKVDADPASAKTANAGAPSVAPPVSSGPWMGPEVRPLDASKYTEKSFGELLGGGDPGINPGKFGLQHNETGKQYLFKPQDLELPVPYIDAMGIKAGDRARKAPAAAELANRMGIKTPKADLVLWNGKIGSLQEWEAGTTKLFDLRTSNPKLHGEIMASQAKKDMDAFQYLIAGMDAHEGNYLVKIDSKTKKWELMPCDMDGSLPPSAARYPARPSFAHQAPLPPSVSKGFRERLEKMGATKDQLRQALKAWLSPDEIEGALKRLDELIADSNPNSPGARIKVE